MPDPYDEGYDAYFDGLASHSNPYSAGSLDALDWEDGWDDAEETDQEYYEADVYEADDGEPSED